jgi:predicted TIM-barrel fold metal-dependent hydrolase
VIVDCHTHLWAPEHLGPPWREEVKGAGGRPVDLTADPEAHARGTAAADVAFAFAFHVPRGRVEVPNDYVAGYARANPDRIVGYLSVDPTEEGALQEMDRAVHVLGLRGLKLGPTYQGYHPLDERALAVYERAAELRLPTTFHMGTTPHPWAELEYARPIHVDEIARSFPQLRIVIAHVAHPWEPEALVVARKHPHVYADVSALTYRPFQLYHTLRLAIEYAVESTLLLGSDFPWLTTADSIAGLRRLAAKKNGIGPPLPEDAVEGIVHRDTLALLGLEDALTRA